MSEHDSHLNGYLLRYLRLRLGWSQARLAAESGVSESLINKLELGRQRVRPRQMATLTGTMGYSSYEVQLYRIQAKGLPRDAGEAAGGEAERRVRCVAAEHGMVSALGFQGALGGFVDRSADDALRREGEEAFRVWAALEEPKQRYLIESHPRFQTLAFVEQISLASERSAGKNPKLPLRFAQLARLAAEKVAGPPEIQALARGYAWAFVANGKRVGVGLREADEAFQISDRWWAQGEKARQTFFETWRLPDLKASLRRDQRRWRESLALSDRALEEAPPSARGRILVKKAAALEPMGEPEEALKALVAATPYVEASGDRDVLLVLAINFAVNLTHVGKLKEARQRLDAARKLALELGRDLHLSRCTWIAGRIAGESGDQGEAVASLEQARGDFTAREMALEAADVALDEAVYLLQAGDYEGVASLAGQMAWVFASEDLGVDVLKALRLFYDAARGQRITLDLALEARALFRKAA